VSEALAFFTDEVLGRHAEIIKENFVGVVTDHCLDGLDCQSAAYGVPHVDEEDREPIGPTHPFADRAGSGEQEHEIRVVCARRPYLLAIDDIHIAAAYGGRRDPPGV
jgi:hypothetical protein